MISKEISQEERMSFVDEFIEVSITKDTLDTLKRKLTSKGYRSLFIHLYKFHKTGASVSQIDLAKRADVQLGNIKYYLHYFEKQNFVIIRPDPKDTRHKLIRTLDNIHWDMLINFIISDIKKVQHQRKLK